MKNDTSEYTGVVEAVSRFAGGLVGTLVIAGKDVAYFVKNTMTVKLESKPVPSTKVTESIKSQAKKRIAEIEKEKATSKQAELKEKTEKSEPLSDSQSCLNPKVSEEASVAVKSQKRQPPVIRKKTSNVKPSGLTAKS